MKTKSHKQLQGDNYNCMVMTWLLGFIMGVSISIIITIIVKGKECLA